MQHLLDLSDLGAEVARLRKARGMTQAELGALAGIAQSTLARLEKGRVAEFGAGKLLRLLEVLGYALATVATDQTFTLDDALRQKQAEAASQASGAAEPGA
jgi:HTH-type transcriptional regulator/antitoxin HipB